MQPDGNPGEFPLQDDEDDHRPGRVIGMVSGPNSSVSGEDGRPVMGEGPRSSFLSFEYGVDMTGFCSVGRGNFVPTTLTPCRNVSLSAHVMPISAARNSRLRPGHPFASSESVSRMVVWLPETNHIPLPWQ